MVSKMWYSSISSCFFAQTKRTLKSFIRFKSMNVRCVHIIIKKIIRPLPIAASCSRSYVSCAPAHASQLSIYLIAHSLIICFIQETYEVFTCVCRMRNWKTLDRYVNGIIKQWRCTIDINKTSRVKMHVRLQRKSWIHKSILVIRSLSFFLPRFPHSTSLQ